MFYVINTIQFNLLDLTIQRTDPKESKMSLDNRIRTDWYEQQTSQKPTTFNVIMITGNTWEEEKELKKAVVEPRRTSYSN